MNLKNSKYEWKREENAFAEIQESANSCTICLVNDPNTLTNCGHFYHLKCIIEWFHRNPKCPLCIKNNYNPVKFYCLSCFSCYNTFAISSSSQYEKIMKKIKGSKCPSCYWSISELFLCYGRISASTHSQTNSCLVFFFDTPSSDFLTEIWGNRRVWSVLLCSMISCFLRWRNSLNSVREGWAEVWHLSLGMWLKRR